MHRAKKNAFSRNSDGNSNLVYWLITLFAIQGHEFQGNYAKEIFQLASINYTRCKVEKNEVVPEN
jgi:hypothetical protein